MLADGGMVTVLKNTYCDFKCWLLWFVVWWRNVNVVDGKWTVWLLVYGGMVSVVDSFEELVSVVVG